MKTGPADTLEPPARLGLVLADGHPLLLQGMQQLFRGEPDLDVLACCTNGEDTLNAVDDHRSALLVLDFRLPSAGGLAVLDALRQRPYSIRVVLLTDRISQDEMTEALRFGVRGVALKNMAPPLLVQCVRQVRQGRMWIEHSSAGATLEQMHRHETGRRELRRTLTRRELQVLQFVAGGLRNKEITAKLDIAEGTVKIHLHNIYEKLGMSDRVQLALRARDEGLV
jgi:DNA-binding NarL/FixJ family response regulator